LQVNYFLEKYKRVKPPNVKQEGVVETLKWMKEHMM
jgi:hypothetical protein